jgi:hypothetical protein
VAGPDLDRQYLTPNPGPVPASASHRRPGARIPALYAPRGGWMLRGACRSQGTTALSIAAGGGAGTLGTAGRSLTLAASVVINRAMAIFASRFAPARRLPVRDVVPGAVTTAVIWQLLQSFGLSTSGTRVHPPGQSPAHKGFQLVDVNFDPPSSDQATTIPVHKGKRRVPSGKPPPEHSVLARIRRWCWPPVATQSGGLRALLRGAASGSRSGCCGRPPTLGWCEQA